MKSTTNGLWNLVRNVRGNVKQDSLSRLLEVDSITVPDLLEKLRAKLSSSLSATEAADSNCADQDCNVEVSEFSVRVMLSRLSPSKAPGYDGIPTKVYRCLADFIALPLSVIFKNSISSHTVPQAWKKGVIIPIPKSNPPCIEKLRYITLLPMPLKILEKLFFEAFGNTSRRLTALTNMVFVLVLPLPQRLFVSAKRHFRALTNHRSLGLLLSALI